MRVSVDVENESDVALGPFKMGLTIDLVPALQSRVDSIGPGEIIVVEFAYRHPVNSETFVDFWVDTDDRIEESNEDDNTDGDSLWPLCS